MTFQLNRFMVQIIGLNKFYIYKIKVHYCKANANFFLLFAQQCAYRIAVSFMFAFWSTVAYTGWQCNYIMEQQYARTGFLLG